MIFNMIANGGGASAPRFGIATGKPTSTESTSLSFTNLLGEPQAFCVILVPKDTKTWLELSPGTDTYYITHFVYDGVEISTGVLTKGSPPFRVYGNGYNAENNAYSFVYSNGTLTISRSSYVINNGKFYSNKYNGQYELLYIY